MEQKFKEARQVINEVDKEMAQLFVKRMKAVSDIAEYKMANGVPILDAKREREVIEKNAELIDDEIIRGYYTNFIQESMRLSKQYQLYLTEGRRVAFSGIEGAFAHIAASRLFPQAKKVPFGNFKDAYDSVVNGDCDVVVLPIENSAAGEVGQVTDIIFNGSLYINGMVDLAVRHALVAPHGAKLEDIKTVVSHPQALNQCSKFIKQHSMKEISYENTALAAEYVAKLNDPTVAAIASEDSAKKYGLDILADGINESGVNTTRFAVLSRSKSKNVATKHGANFVLMFTVKNEAGSLARALNIIGAHGFNLGTLRSRPMRELLWEYYFYIEAEGNIHSSEGRSMMEELAVCCDKLKSVGSFVRQSI
ncbi:MAG: chorismate mutase [Clostridia bacterium]|nr:chorismate mutase [Clostridia bacterium]